MRFLSYSTKMALPILVFSFLSCSEVPTKGDLVHLNGYWEIKEVVFPNGGTKAYKANMDVDFFSLEGEAGYRKKVQPKFNGHYQTSDDAQPFTVQTTDGALQLHYSNELTTWAETLIALNKGELVLKNEDGITYHYIRYEPFNLEN